MKARFITFVSVALATAIAVSAQNAAHTENSRDQALRGSGRINASTLGMEFNLPLASYPGRGIDVPIGLSYSSKVWRIEFQLMRRSGQNYPPCYSKNYALFAEDSEGGWTSSLGAPFIRYVGAENHYDGDTGGVHNGNAEVVCDPGNEDPPAPLAEIRRLSLHLPSGEVHELRRDDTPTAEASTWDGTYYAVDGSNIRYTENSANGIFRVQLPDGSFYDLNAGAGTTDRKANKYTDRNGNFTTYHPPTTQHPDGYWTDTLGRVLPLIPRPPDTPGSKTYSVPGLNGGSVQYIFRYKQLQGATAAQSALTDFNNSIRYVGDKYHTSTYPYWATRPPGTSLFASDGDSFVMSEGLFNPILLTEIELPTGQSYKFSYNIYGEIDRIVYPTGGVEAFTHAEVPAHAQMELPYKRANRGVTNRKVYESASDTTPYEWAYTFPANGSFRTTNPDGTMVERWFNGGSVDAPFGFDSVLTGMQYRELSFSSTGQLVAQRLTKWAQTMSPVYPNAERHPRVEYEESIVYDWTGNGVSATTYTEYEGDLSLKETPVLPKRSTAYAFVATTSGGLSPGASSTTPSIPSAAPTTPLRINESTFLINDPNHAAVTGFYTAQNIHHLVTVSDIKDGVGNIVSRMTTSFDEPGRSPGYRGNPTSTLAWDSTKGAVTTSSAYIITSARFDAYGNQYEATDAKGNTTTTTFDGTYHAFPIQVTSPIPSDGTHGSSIAFVTTATFDPTTGLPLSTTDANLIETRITYDQATLRPLNTKTYYDNVQAGSTAEMEYHEEEGNYWVKNRAQIDADKWAETITFFDGLGRAWKTEEINSKGNIFVEKEFDAQGRVKRVSNPFRAGETKVWTTNVYDEASRVKEVTFQDGATVKTDYGVSMTGVIGVTKQITDQAGKKRKGVSDALGRMIRVIEDPTGTTPLSTDYIFDTLGNLRKTIQDEQNRFFLHDSLGRLLYAKQPEQDTRSAFIATDPVTGNTAWSVRYEYDDNGNITKTTDARGVYIQGTYDALNRLKLRDYSDATPDVSFYYDGKYVNINDQPQTASGSVKGKTTGVKSSVSRTNHTSFDNLGRLLTHQQITDGQTYGTSYTYNLSGGLVSETYPSNRVINYDINADGDLSRVWGHKGTTVSTYANAFNYNASGGVEKMRLGNGKWETAVYNNRLQITQIGLGSGSNDTSLLKLEYGYGNNTQNNGNLRSQKISFNGLAQPFEQTYTYDDLNRLQIAEEKVGTTTTWKQTFLIDRYGNREFDPANTTTLGSCPQAVCNPDISTERNRITTAGYGYDANGNLTQGAAGQRFAYDAENHQKEFFAVGNGSITPDATYSYDGDGKRVKKISPTETTVFVYNAGGTLVAEYSTALATAPQVSYLTADHLGSPRVITNQLGAVTTRKDFTAFGEENFTAQRTSALGYVASDDLRKGYTGYEKDDESGLDFAQARYYNATHGRFTSVDPLTASATIRNPQTFNRYSYVLNSPYKYTDPLGLLPWTSSGACGEWCKNSGPYVDGSAFRGRDASLDGLKTLTEIWREFVAQVSAALGIVEGQTASFSPASPDGVLVNTIRGPFIVSAEALAPYGLEGDYPNTPEQRSYGNGDCPVLAQNLIPNDELGVVANFVQGTVLYRGSEPDRVAPARINQIFPIGTSPEPAKERYADIARGTVIFTPNSEGRYDDKKTGNHVAIFLSYGIRDGKNGIYVIDQYLRKGNSSMRFIEARTGGSRSDNARAFAVVLRIQQIRITKVRLKIF